MDKEYINRVTEDIFVEDMSKLEIKTEVYKRLDKELKCADRLNLKMLEYEIQQLDDDEIEFTNYIVMGIDDRNLADYDEENLGWQTGDDDGKELDFG